MGLGDHSRLREISGLSRNHVLSAGTDPSPHGMTSSFGISHIHIEGEGRHKIEGLSLMPVIENFPMLQKTHHRFLHFPPLILTVALLRGMFVLTRMYNEKPT